MQAAGAARAGGCSMRIPPVILCLAALAGCAPYSLHRPARVPGAGETQIGISVDLVAFFARVAEEERSPDRLDEWLVMPTLRLRQGVGGGAELDLSVFPLGVRAGGRLRLFESGRAAAVAEAGLTVAAAITTGDDPSNWRALLLPDAALAFGWSPASGDQAYAALRYLWLRDKIAGAGFTHAPGLTLGYAFEVGAVDLDAEVTALLSPSSSDLLLAPGFSASVGAD